MTDNTQAITRSYPLDDLVVRTDGGGRIVEAYTAVFDSPAEVRDFDGHYIEFIHQRAFNDVLHRSKTKPIMLFNHGKDVYGKSSDRFSLPIGVPENITADTRGLLTVSRISNTPLGDEVLELMRDGAVTGFSFTGAPIRSRRVAAKSRDELPTIVRTQLGLSEYGPGVFPTYADARVVAMRAESLADELGQLPPDELAELVGVLRTRIPDLADLGRSEGAGSADDPDPPTPAVSDIERRLLAARLKGLHP